VTGRLRPSVASRWARATVLGTAVAAGLGVTVVGGPPWALLAVAVALISVVGVWLAVIDLRTHLLPDWLVLPTSLAVAVLLVLSWVDDGNAGTLLRAAASAAVTLVVYTAMSRWGSLGFGDVKLGVLLALVLGWAGWSAAFAGPALGFVLGAIVAVVLLASGRGSKTYLAFGPYLIAGALVVLIRQLAETAG
jgi:leader peptidase (prepilin peptidase)/N-methyltransferase